MIKLVTVGDAVDLDPWDLRESVEQVHDQPTLVERDRLQAGTNLGTAAGQLGWGTRVPKLPSNPGEVVDCGGGAGHPLKARGSGLPEIVGGAHLIATVALKERQLSVEESGMRPVELIRGAEQEVGVERLHINGVVRRGADRIEHRERTGLVGETNNLLRWVDGTNGIRRHADRNDLGARGAQCGIRLNVEGGIARADRNDL